MPQSEQHRQFKRAARGIMTAVQLPIRNWRPCAPDVVLWCDSCWLRDWSIWWSWSCGEWRWLRPRLRCLMRPRDVGHSRTDAWRLHTPPSKQQPPLVSFPVARPDRWSNRTNRSQHLFYIYELFNENQQLQPNHPTHNIHTSHTLLWTHSCLKRVNNSAHVSPGISIMGKCCNHRWKHRTFALLLLIQSCARRSSLCVKHTNIYNRVASIAFSACDCAHTCEPVCVCVCKLWIIL